MRNIIVLLLLSLIVRSAYSQQDTTAVYPQSLITEPLKIVHLTGDYYIYTTYKWLDGKLFPANGMYLLTNSGVVMFDSPWDSSQFQPLLDSIDHKHHMKVVLCIATHFHEDRTGGFDFLKQKEIATYSSKMTYDLCKQKGEKQAAFYFMGDTVFRIGDHVFEIYYPGEGHTKDNIVIWCGDQKILYGGCLVKSTENNSLGNISDASLDLWPISIKNVMGKFPRPAYTIPGHFGWEGKSSLQHTLNLLKQANKRE